MWDLRPRLRRAQRVGSGVAAPRGPDDVADERPAVFGRDKIIEQLAKSRAPLTVLSGDSGVGKSEVLSRAQVMTTKSIAPRPRSLPSSGGVLQRILLDCLGDVLAEDIRRRGSAREASRFVVLAAERVVADRGQELARVLGREVLNVARSRLGPDAGAAIAEYVSSLKETVDERLAVRLDTALDRPVAELVIALAGEVLGYIQPTNVVLALDAGERLPAADVALLGDLARTLTSGIRIRIAVSTYTAEHQAIVDQLRRVGSQVAELQLEGIEEPAIRKWLEAEGLSADRAPDVQRATGGYALHVGDLIAHLRSGGDIAGAPLSESFARLTDEAWSGLPPEIASRARQLCVLSDPLPTTQTLELLGIDAATWGETKARLARARVFSVDINGLPWFHEQRRRYLSELKLDQEERASACADAANALHRVLIDSGRLDRLGELAGLVSSATHMLSAREQLRSAVALSRSQLAVCAALVELMEPGMTAPGIEGGALLRYARTMFDGGPNLIEAFRELRTCPFLVLVEQGEAAMAIPDWEDALVVLVICGRAENELGRTPIPAVAGSVFEGEIKPRLQPFSLAGYGVGTITMAMMAEHAVALRRGITQTLVDQRAAGPNLLVRAEYVGRGLGVHACFANSDDRDAAAEKLRDLDIQVLGERFADTDVLPHPVAPVPARRFLLAAERLLGENLRLGPDGIRGQRTLTAPITGAERLGVRSQVMQVVRSLSSAHERYAMGLEWPTGFLYFEDDQGFDVAEVLGGREDARPFPAFIPIGNNDPFWAYSIEAVAELQPNERIAVVNHSVSRVPRLNDPVIETLNALAERAKRFNAVQSRRELTFDEASLQAELEAALNTQLADARALQTASLFQQAAVTELSGMDYDVELMRPDDSVAQVFGGRWWGSLVIETPNNLNRDRVTVRIGVGAFSKRPDELIGHTFARRQGDATQTLADLLGHQQADVQVSYTA